MIRRKTAEKWRSLHTCARSEVVGDLRALGGQDDDSPQHIAADLLEEAGDKSDGGRCSLNAIIDGLKARIDALEAEIGPERMAELRREEAVNAPPKRRRRRAVPLW